MSRPLVVQRPPLVRIPQQRPLLSELVEAGRRLHGLCRWSYVLKVQPPPHYASEWHTCALAAAYAAAFGKATVETVAFSRTNAVFLLSGLVGYDIACQVVDGPTGRRGSTVEAELAKLIDDDLWTRQAVSAWLASIGL